MLVVPLHFETGQHIHVTCPFFRAIWNLVLGHCNFYITDISTPTDFPNLVSWWLHDSSEAFRSTMSISSCTSLCLVDFKL
uniref:Uncharacterized protein n=1 Tax=Aegilops tauschii subsp. strangulata TaxID=200361 RepID=A0A452ZR65_AEGTS